MPNTYFTQNELDVLNISISQTKRDYEGNCAYYEECIKANDEDCDRYKGKLAWIQQRIKEIDGILPKLRKKKRKAKSNKCTCQGLQHRTDCPKWVLCF